MKKRRRRTSFDRATANGEARTLPVPPNIMSTSVLRLTELHTELLEQILLHLSVPDLVKVEAVRRAIDIHGPPLTDRG
jgi:hypothetical protein